MHNSYAVHYQHGGPGAQHWLRDRGHSAWDPKTHTVFSPFRESALQNADEEDASKSTLKKGKRKAAAVAKMGSDEDDGPAEKKLVSRAEERLKNKRTVFVGNLPISCTKKVESAPPPVSDMGE